MVMMNYEDGLEKRQMRAVEENKRSELLDVIEDSRNSKS